MLQEQDEAKKKDKKTMCKQTRNSREKEFVKKKKKNAQKLLELKS